MTHSTCGFLCPFDIAGSSIPASLFRSSEIGGGDLVVRDEPSAHNLPILRILYSVLRILSRYVRCYRHGTRSEQSVQIGLMAFSKSFWERLRST